jgi:hypothetical protein
VPETTTDFAVWRLTLEHQARIHAANHFQVGGEE